MLHSVIRPKKNIVLRKDPHCGDGDEEMNNRIAQVGFVAYQRAKIKNVPVARYDTKRKTVYLLYPDGTRQDVK